jgi:MSHA biogenesis protein MshQ
MHLPESIWSCRRGDIVFWVMLAWMVAVPSVGHAATYAFQATTYSWETAVNNVVWDQTCTSYPRDDDKTVVNIGFTFNFAGVDYTQVRVHSNGALQFGADTGFHRQYTNTDLPITAAPGAYGGGCANVQADRAMLIYWDDINPNLGGTVRYETKGTAPNRRFVVSWENVPHYNLGGAYTFQVILYENGEFVYQYGTGNADGATATIGVEVGNTDYTLYEYNTSYGYPGTAIRWYIAAYTPALLAQYAFEESTWSGALNEIIDWSGNDHHGVRLGTAQTTATGRVCRGANIPANTAIGTVDAVNSNLDVDATIGTNGSVTFWYRSIRAWSGGTARDHQLLDATNLTNYWFFLVKRSTGQLRFVVSDSAGTAVTAETAAQTVAATTWKHIGVTWHVAPGTNQTILRIYLDGTLLTTATGTTNGSLPVSLSTLFLGDNRGAATGLNGTGNSADGILDEARIYNYDIGSTGVTADMNATHGCGSFNHVRIQHDGAGLTCTPETVTVLACADSTCSTTYNGSVTVDLTSPATGWVTDPITFTGGSTTASLRVTTPSTVTLGATATTPAAVFSTRCFSETTETCSLTFNDSGFVFDVPNHAADAVQTVTLSAVRKDDATQKCVPTFQNVTRSVNFSSNYINPNTGTLAVNLNGTNISGSGTAIDLTFNGTGDATLAVRYPDVGQVRLHASYALSASENMTGQDDFVARPAGFALVISGNPAADDANGNVFRHAGENFPITVRALNSNDVLTPNYGHETSPETVALTAVLVAPSGGNNPTLNGSFGSFSQDCSGNPATAGTACGTFNWPEVGIITLTPAIGDGNYLGAGNVTGTTSGNVGRFTPAYFNVTRSHGCTGGATFTYSGQPFAGVTVTAMNLAGGTTSNFSGAAPAGFAKDTTISNAGTFTGGAFSNGTLAAADFSSGARTGTNVTYTFTAKDTEPVTLTLRATDTDTVSSSAGPAGSEATAEIRSGRIRVHNANGSELADLWVPMYLEQYSAASGWAPQVDTCSSVTLSALSNFQGNLGSGETCVQDIGNPGVSGEGCAAVGPASERFGALPASGAPPPPPLGSYNLYLLRPGAGNDGSVDVSANLGSRIWLRYDWDGNGTDGDPTGKATFGTYRGNPRHIYLREIYR